MERSTAQLTLEDAEVWIEQLGISPEDLLSNAKVKSTWRQIKHRWKKDEAPEDREKIRNALIQHEKKKRTEIGSLLLSLDEWKEIGARLALNPEVFHSEVERLRAIADKVKRKHDADQEAAAAAAELDAELSTSHGVPKESKESTAAFESPTFGKKLTRSSSRSTPSK